MKVIFLDFHGVMCLSEQNLVRTTSRSNQLGRPIVQKSRKSYTRKKKHKNLDFRL